MKQYFLLLFICIGTTILSAQIPQGINYQAVARDAAGTILANQTMDLQVAIQDAPTGGTIVYQERFQGIQTDQFGLLQLVIGQGTSTGDLAGVDWTAGPYFLKIDLDLLPGSVSLPSTPFQAVPYAFAAGRSLGDTDRFWEEGITNNIYYNEGNIGIGTETPDRQLELAGTGPRYLRVGTSSTGSNPVGLELNRGSEFSATDYRIVNDGSGLKFESGVDNFTTTPTEFMAIANGGNVGIGTPAPPTKLAVEDEGAVGITVQTNSTEASYIDLARASGTARDWRMINTLDAFQLQYSFDEFASDPTTSLSVSPQGIAIGRLGAPSVELHVRGAGQQRVRVQTSDAEEASYGLFSDGPDFRLTNDAGRLRLQRSTNSFFTSNDVLDIQTDGTFRIRQDLNMSDQSIVNVAPPTGGQHVVNRNYLEDYVADQMELNRNIFPTEISSQANNQTFAECALRCRTLTQGGHNDWGLPSAEQLSQFVNGNPTSSTFCWTSTAAYGHFGYAFDDPQPSTSNFERPRKITIRLTTGETEAARYNENRTCFCVR
ncbi:MAG: hypothetical protein AAFQ37_03685 [Bacteroidota bacterium]